MSKENKNTARIFEIKRFAIHDGDGIRTTVFFKGCPLRCVWCHNPEGLIGKKELGFFSHKCSRCGKCVSVCEAGAHFFNEKGERKVNRRKCIGCGKCVAECPSEALVLYGRDVSVEELLPILTEDAEFYKASNGGVTLSGGECLMWADFCAELLEKLHEKGIRTAVDTCGDVPREAILKVLPHTDVFLYDIKLFDSERHEWFTGRPNDRILDNLRFLDSVGAPCEIRIPYVPEINGEELEKIAGFLSGLSNIVRVRVLPYHDLARSKYGAIGLKECMPKKIPTEKQLLRAKSYFENINSKNG